MGEKLYIMNLVNSRILLTALASWIIAQILKALIYAIMHRTLDIKRLFGDGGMPSGHSATVTSLATMVALNEGIGSTEFAIAFVLAIIVMHDAMSIRREAGKHAKALNEIKLMSDPNTPAEQMFKEFLGHTPSQVIVGALLGFGIACLSYNFF